jgi:hypothetical protein
MQQAMSEMAPRSVLVNDEVERRDHKQLAGG